MKIFKVKGYDLTDKQYGRRSSASFKLDLRYACKKSNLYFKSADTDYVQNLGQLLFGVPSKWKGLFSMTYNEEGNLANIEIFLDHRISMFEEHIEDIKSLLKEGLNILKKERIIKDYKEIGS